MKKVIEAVFPYAAACCAGCLIMPEVMEIAYEWRGYKAFGGEMLIIPLLLCATWLISNVNIAFTEAKPDRWSGDDTEINTERSAKTHG